MIPNTVLIEEARKARENAYTPHSGYGVGAAIVTPDGALFTGCNIENDSFTQTLHAEEVALSKAVSSGYREFDRLAVSTPGEDAPEPCGHCKQVLTQFCDESLTLVLDTGTDDVTFVEQEFDPQFSLE